MYVYTIQHIMIASFTTFVMSACGMETILWKSGWERKSEFGWSNKPTSPPKQGPSKNWTLMIFYTYYIHIRMWVFINIRMWVFITHQIIVYTHPGSETKLFADRHIGLMCDWHRPMIHTLPVEQSSTKHHQRIAYTLREQDQVVGGQAYMPCRRRPTWSPRQPLWAEALSAISVLFYTAACKRKRMWWGERWREREREWSKVYRLCSEVSALLPGLEHHTCRPHNYTE